MPAFIIQSLASHGRVETGLGISITGGLFFIAVLTFVLRSGRYLLSGHLYLLMVFVLIWRELFFGFSSMPLTRLDTIVLLLAVLPMAPLLTNKKGLALHFLANFIVLGLFIAFNPEAHGLQPGELDAYAMDAFIAMTATAVTAYLLTRTSERARRRIESTNADLEVKVRLRTNALRRAAEELRASRDAMHRDLETARHVQQSLLYAETPAVDNFDIAYYYRPMAQVSGDFYDFQTRAGELTGVGVFDVSGHGIASGLLTILARSIIMRVFQEGDSPNLTLRKANEELVMNLQQGFNFISGLLLRFTGNHMELANAGHPDPLVKREGENAFFLTPEDQGQERGGLLGLHYFKGDYPLIKYDLKTGDALLLYSDGIVEAETADFEAYGPDRLRSSLDRARGSARARLDELLREHALFMNDLPPGDDITLVLMIKR